MGAGTVSTAGLIFCVVIFLFHPESILADEVECGQRKITFMGYVLGGESALALFRTPYGKPRRYICGGSIISVNFVLTAAYAVYRITADELEVHLGLHNRSNPTEYSKIHKVKEVTIHHQYNVMNSRNNIALLLVENDIEYTDYIQPICLWPDAKSDLQLIVNTSGYVAGWGITEQGVAADVLQEAQLMVVDYETCLASDNKTFYSLLSISQSNYCAGTPNKATVCPGDSGGGMYFEISNSWYIRGLVSGGKRPERAKPCDPAGFVVFTDVSHYLKWINVRMKAIESRNLLNLANCGLDHHDSTIAEKEKLLFQQYPWTVVLEYNRSVQTDNLAMCSGALIHERFVLTVGHCAVASSFMYKLESVRLGEYDLNSNPDNEKNVEGQEVTTFIQSIDIEEIFLHPKFDKPRYDNNIALLKLEYPADTSRSSIQPICLPTLPDFEESFTISGWKRVGKRTKIIQRNSIAVAVDMDSCKSSYSKYNNSLDSEEHFLCAEPNGGCYHYIAGSPLQYLKSVDRRNRYFLKGLFAYGFPRCAQGSMDIFIDVNGYTGWIKQTLEKEGFH